MTIHQTKEGNALTLALEGRLDTMTAPQLEAALKEALPHASFGCGITLDTYWAQAGGADPAQWLRRLDGRVNCVHFKDMVFSPEDKGVRMAAIGEGNMNYPEILKACDDAHVEYGFVEQDNCYGEDPFLCLKRSYEYLTAQGLE